MSVFYQTQIEQNSKLLAIEPSISNFRNFLLDDHDQAAIYEYLKRQTSKENPAKVYTVCNFHLGGRDFIDFDKVDENIQFIHQPYSISAFCDHIHVIDNDSSNEILRLTKYCYDNDLKDIYTGFLICDEKKTFIDLAEFYAFGCEIYSPLALLTKKLVQGVGDDDSDFIGKPNILTSWYGRKIYFSDEKPHRYKDLTEKLFYSSNDIYYE